MTPPGTEHAFHYLERYRHTANVPVFNDDIQGTGAVVLSGFVNAAKLSSEASGRPLTDHKVLFLGAGSAGVGVGKQVMSFFTLQGMSEEDAKKQIYFIDSQGLITADRPKLQQHKICEYPYHRGREMLTTHSQTLRAEITKARR